MMLYLNLILLAVAITMLAKDSKNPWTALICLAIALGGVAVGLGVAQRIAEHTLPALAEQLKACEANGQKCRLVAVVDDSDTNR